MEEQPKSLWDKLNTSVKELWEKDKVFFILFGIIIITIKFRDIIIDILVSSSKRVLTDSEIKDTTLAKQESEANKAANALVNRANEAPLKEKPVDENWNKND